MSNALSLPPRMDRSGRSYPDRPFVGIGAVVFKEESVLLIRRGRPPRQGSWSLPGGLQEVGETVFAAAAREVLEETGLTIQVIDLVDVVDSITRDNEDRTQYHYTLVDVRAEWRAGEAVAIDLGDGERTHSGEPSGQPPGRDVQDVADLATDQLACPQCLEVDTSAEGASLPGQHRDQDRVVLSDSLEGLIQLCQHRRRDRLVDDSGEGQLNKELTSVFILRDDRPLGDYVLQTSEVDAVFDAPISDLLQLFAGDLDTIELSGVQLAGSPDAYPVSISANLEDFVPGDSYWVNLFVMCERFLNGEQPLAI